MISSESSFTEMSNLQGDSVKIENFRKSFHFLTGNLTNFRLEKSFFIKKKNPIRPELESIFIYPNPTLIGSTIIINADIPEFNKIVIFNSEGRLIFEKSLTQSRQIVLPNPILSSGIYFVRLQQDNKPVSDWAKLMVVD